MNAHAAFEPNPRAVQGANRPPSPFDAFEAHIADLYEEARHFLDGDGVSSEGQATAITALMDQLRTAKKDADAARAEEKRPHDEAAKEVQAKWKPLIDKADLAVSTCKTALTPWLQKLEAERLARAEQARQEAERKAREAQEAARAAQASADLAERERAEALAKEATQAGKAATKAEKATASTASGARAVSLRSYWSAEITDLKEACRHFWAANPEAFRALIQQLADTDVRNGKRQIPGVVAVEERRPV